jgi:hypothetical protein
MADPEPEAAPNITLEETTAPSDPPIDAIKAQKMVKPLPSQRAVHHVLLASPSTMFHSPPPL